MTPADRGDNREGHVGRVLRGGGRRGGQIRRPREIKRPDIPPGPLRELNNFLHELRDAAGRLSVEAIAQAIADNDELPGAPSADTVWRCFSAARRPAKQHDVTAIAHVLADPARMIPQNAAAHAGELWMKARNPPVILQPSKRTQYLSAIVRRYRVLELATLTPEDEDSRLSVQLRGTFVPLTARPDPPPIDLPREMSRRLIESGSLDPSELVSDRSRDKEGGDDRSDLQDWVERAHRAREEYLAKPPRPVSEILMDPLCRTTLILGDPGSGKTTLLRYIAVSLAGHAQDLPDDLAPWAGWLPVVIELREYAGRTWRSGHRADATLLGYLDYLSAHDGCGLPHRMMDALLAGEPRIVVMFDGLDELFDPAERALAAEDIASFAAKYDRVRVIVTSRPVGDRRNTLHNAGFAVYMLQDLERSQIIRFAESWFRIVTRNDSAKTDLLTRRLMTAIDDSPPIRELSGNPMLLTILAIIGRRRRLPRERHRVFAHATDVLIEHWDVNRAIRDPAAGMEIIGEEEKRELLRRVARRMQDGVGGIAANHIHGDDLTEEFRLYIVEQYPRLPDGQAKLMAKAMLRQFSERNFILSKFGPGMYGFVHRAFLEYCCAAEIVYRFEKTQELTMHELATEVFPHRATDPVWHEVLLLVAEMIEGSRLAIVVDQLLDLATSADGRVRNFGEHWLLAVECLAEAQSMRRLGLQYGRAAYVLTALLTALRVRLRFQSDVLGFDTDFFENRGASFERLRRGVGVLRELTVDLPSEEIVDWYRSIPALVTDLAQDIGEREWHALATEAVAAVSPEESGRTAAISHLERHPNVTAAVVPVLAARWPDKRTRAELTVLLADRDWRVRAAVVPALVATWPDDTTRTQLVELLADRSGDVLDAVLTALATRWRDETTHAVLLTKIKADHWRVRLAAVQALSAGWPDEDTRTVLIDRSADDNARVRLAALQALSAGWPDDRSRRLLVRRMADPNAGIRLAVAGTLPTWPGQESHQLLVDALSDRIWQVRYAALTALATGWPDDNTYRLLVSEIDDEEGRLRDVAIQLLTSGWRDSTCKELLIDRAASSDWRIRQAVLLPLAATWPDQSVRIAVRTCLRDENWHVRCAATRALATAWPDADTYRLVTEQARSRTDSRLESVRPDIVQKWRRSRSPEVLTQHVNHAAAQVQQAAIEALADNWHDDRTRDILIECLPDADRDTRLLILRMLANGWHDDWVRNTVTGHMSDDDWRVRLASVRALVAGWPDERTLSELVRRASDVNWRVRLGVAQALAAGWPADQTTIEVLATRATQDLLLARLAVKPARIAEKPLTS